MPARKTLTPPCSHPGDRALAVASAQVQTRADRGGLVALLLALLVFSLGFPLVKAIPLPAAGIALPRLLLAAALIAVAAVLLRQRWPRPTGPVLVAGLAFGAHQLLYISATQRTSIAVVTLVGALQPLLVAVLAPAVVRERVRPVVVGWCAVAVGGVALVVLADVGDPARSTAGDVLAVINLLAFTVYFLAAKRARQAAVPATTLTVTQYVVASAVVLPAFLLAGAPLPGDPRPAAADAAVVAGAGVTVLLVVLLALGPGNGHLLLNWAHARTSAALAALVLAAVPLLASVWAALLYDEPLGWVHLVGAVLVAVSIEGARRAEARSTVRTAAPPASGPSSA